MSAESDVLDFALIEAQKENIVASKRGRSVAALKAQLKPDAATVVSLTSSTPLPEPFSLPSLLFLLFQLTYLPLPAHTESYYETRRATMEAELAAYDGSDPLQPWLKYLGWVSDACTSLAQRHEALIPAFERFFATFKADARYHQDARFARAIASFADLLPDPSQLFAFLVSSSLCSKHAHVHCAQASYHLRARRWPAAEAALARADAAGAEPASLLSSMRLQLVHAMSSWARAQEAAGAADPFADAPLPGSDGTRAVDVAPVKRTPFGAIASAAAAATDADGTSVATPLPAAAVAAAPAQQTQPQPFQRPQQQQQQSQAFGGVAAAVQRGTKPPAPSQTAAFVIFCDDDDEDGDNANNSTSSSGSGSSSGCDSPSTSAAPSGARAHAPAPPAGVVEAAKLLNKENRRFAQSVFTVARAPALSPAAATALSSSSAAAGAAGGPPVSMSLDADAVEARMDAVRRKEGAGARAAAAAAQRGAAGDAVIRAAAAAAASAAPAPVSAPISAPAPAPTTGTMGLGAAPGMGAGVGVGVGARIGGAGTVSRPPIPGASLGGAPAAASLPAAPGAGAGGARIPGTAGGVPGRGLGLGVGAGAGLGVGLGLGRAPSLGGVAGAGPGLGLGLGAGARLGGAAAGARTGVPGAKAVKRL